MAIDAARLAGSAVMRHYQQPSLLEYKLDGSPLTLADRASHQVIMSQLAPSDINIVSEEGREPQIDSERYWLVDPLDGTKDFLACNGEFTINIAMIDQKRPILGVIFAPAIGDLYWGAEGMGSWRIRGGAHTALVQQEEASSCRMAVSRFHDHPDVEIFASENRIVHRVAIGSALKYGLLAAAEVDVFPRLVGSSEWDTAAGQAVLEFAGGCVLDWNMGKPLKYGKPHRRNPKLLSFRAPYRRNQFKIKIYNNESK